jgi:hypothetical protein
MMWLAAPPSSGVFLESASKRGAPETLSGSGEILHDHNNWSNDLHWATLQAPVAASRAARIITRLIFALRDDECPALQDADKFRGLCRGKSKGGGNPRSRP